MKEIMKLATPKNIGLVVVVIIVGSVLGYALTGRIVAGYFWWQY